MSRPKRKFKYDNNDGLMPEITKLVSPPSPDVPTSSRREQNEAKKAEAEIWKNAEAQTCSYCFAGGNILCCEGCPASFHLNCLAITENDLPDGIWLCNRCQNMPVTSRTSNSQSSCSSSVPLNPLIRGEREKVRNEDAFRVHFNREAEKNVKWPNKRLLNSLSKMNHTEYKLPLVCAEEQQPFPHDSREKAREDIFNEICVHCETKNPYSVMLKCDFCPNKYHMGCVNPPLTVKPTWRLWMCPRHVENIAEDAMGYRIMAISKRAELWNSFNKIDTCDDAMLSTWRKLCDIASNRRRLIHRSKYGQQVEKQKTLFTPFSYDIPSTSNELMIEGCSDETISETCVNRMLKLRSAKITDRRMSRNKRLSLTKDKCIDVAFDFEFMKPRVRRSKTREPERTDPELDELDKNRSIPMTKEQIFESLFSSIPHRRKEQYENGLPDETVENMTTIAKMNDTILARNEIISSVIDEQEIINRNWHSLDINDGIRGGSVKDYRPKSRSKEERGRRRILADSDTQLIAHGYANSQHTRRMNSFATEMFFTRCPPPPRPFRYSSPNSLRHTLLCSRRSTAEFGGMVRVHPVPELLTNLVIIMYDHSFNSEEQRNQLYVSSMSFWSKETFQTVMERYRKECENSAENLEMEMEIENNDEKVVKLEPDCLEEVEPKPEDNDLIKPEISAESPEKLNGIIHETSGSQSSKYPSELPSPYFDDNVPDPSQPSCSYDVRTTNGTEINAFLYDNVDQKEANQKLHNGVSESDSPYESNEGCVTIETTERDEPSCSKTNISGAMTSLEESGPLSLLTSLASRFECRDDGASTSNSTYSPGTVGVVGEFRESEDVAPNSVSSSIKSFGRSSYLSVEVNKEATERKDSVFSMGSITECSPHSQSSSTSTGPLNLLSSMKNGTRRFSNMEESGPLIKEMINRKNRSLSPVTSPKVESLKNCDSESRLMATKMKKLSKREEMAKQAGTISVERLHQIFTSVREETINREILKERQIENTENGVHSPETPSSSSAQQSEHNGKDGLKRNGELENGSCLDTPSTSAQHANGTNDSFDPDTSDPSLVVRRFPKLEVDCTPPVVHTESPLPSNRTPIPWQLRDHDYVVYHKNDIDVNVFNFECKFEVLNENGSPVPKMTRKRGRGRPIGSKSKKTVGEVVESPKKRGRPKGSTTKKNVVCPKKLKTAPAANGQQTEGRVISSDLEEIAAPPPQVTKERLKKLRDEAEAVRAKYAAKIIARSNETMKTEYFRARDAAIQKWTSSQWEQLVNRCYDDRYNSSIPFDTRFFLPEVTVWAVLEVVSITHKLNLLPFAIQRGLTKIGSANDCHVKVDRLAKNYCSGIEDYHCDIVFDKLSKKFYLSTLGKSKVIVNGVVVYRKKLSALEESLRLRMMGKERKSDAKIVCHCDDEISKMKLNRSSGDRNTVVDDGVIALKSESTIRIGCVELRIRFPQNW